MLVFVLSEEYTEVNRYIYQSISQRSIMKEVEMAKTYDYDVLYIGSGHGTFDGAIPLAQTGKKVGVIETDMIGGTCPNYGCNAKIALDQPVVLKRALENLSSITANDLQIDWQQNFKNLSLIHI